MTEIGDTRSKVASIPPVTGLNLVLSLCALPAVALVTSSFQLGIGPVTELVVQWAIAFAVVGIALGVEDRSLAELGVRRPGLTDIGYLVGTTAVVLLVFVSSEPLLRAVGLPVESGTGTLTTTVGLPIALAGAVTTGLVEEVCFRGYPIERLLDRTDSPLLAGVLPWAVFTAAHAVLWPVGNLLPVAVVAAILTAVYLRRRTLAPVVGAHVLVWVLAVLGQFYG